MDDKQMKLTYVKNGVLGAKACVIYEFILKLKRACLCTWSSRSKPGALG